MKQKINVTRLASIILISLFSISSCEKEDLTPPDNYTSVILRDMTGLDGCTYLLEKQNHEFLEPVNLDEFNVQLEAGKEYWIIYENPAYGSNCMAGEIIQLLDFRSPFLN